MTPLLRSECKGTRLWETGWGPWEKDKAEIYRTRVGAAGCGGALASQAGEHQAASKGLPPLEFLSFTENQE